MAIYGYARVSTSDQDLTVQLDALRKAGCDVIRAEKITGTSTEGSRRALHLAIEVIQFFLLELRPPVSAGNAACR